jgi:DNA-binding response OmpR family regulator
MSKRVLVIDDETNIRRMLRLTLAAAGYEVGEANDGVHGLELFGDGTTWDVVLLDQKMPGMDGLETLRHIKQRSTGARVIMVTAFASIELAVDAMKLGATDFVRKPMTPETIRNAVTAALTKPAPVAASSATPEPAAEKTDARPHSLIQTITLNGFEIMQPTAEASMRDPNSHRFLVKSPEGPECEVIVRIGEDVVGYVERMTRRTLPAANSFWRLRSERFLGDYLWREGKLPSAGELTLNEIDRNELLMAERWEGD